MRYELEKGGEAACLPILSMELNPYKARILSVLIKKGRYMITAQIAKAAHMSWNTAECHLEEMEDMGWLEKKGRTKLYWKAIVNK